MAVSINKMLPISQYYLLRKCEETGLTLDIKFLGSSFVSQFLENTAWWEKCKHYLTETNCLSFTAIGDSQKHHAVNF